MGMSGSLVMFFKEQNNVEVNRSIFHKLTWLMKLALEHFQES